MRVLSSPLVVAFTLFSGLRLVCGVLADPDYGSVWPSGLTEHLVTKGADALLYLHVQDGLSSGIPLTRLIRGADVSLFSGALVRLAGDAHQQPPPIPLGAPWIAVQTCKDANPATLLRASTLGASAAVLYTTTAEPCLSLSHSLASYARASRVPSLSVFVVRDARDASMLETIDLPTMDELVNASQAVLLDLQPGSPMNVQKRGTSNESMIVLYTITGGVAALFCILIGTGIFRAWRHPERYRIQHGEDPGAFGTGAGGTLTRAILDTFPVIKFGAPARASQEGSDEEKDPHLYEMGERRGSTEKRMSGASEGEGRDGEWNLVERHMTYVEDPGRPLKPAEDEAEASTSTSPASTRPRPRPAREPLSAPAEEAPLPDQIGRETCPICIVDFEEGDDLRVLPCDGHHRFHQTCVDPWLLELSTSCPLCRQDFVALQNIISGASQDGHFVDPHAGELGHWELRESGPRHSSVYGRFSKYLRFALARRRGLRGSRGGEQFEEEVPPLPTEPPPAVLASHSAIVDV